MPLDPAHGRVCVVLNTASRRGRDAVEDVRRLLADAGLGHARIDAVPSGGALDAAIGSALATQPDLLVVGGGDGSLSAAAGQVAGTGTTLGVLPLGTANDFARTCQIPDRLDEAVRSLSRPWYAPQVGGPFPSASLGNDAIGRTRTAWRSRLLGRASSSCREKHAIGHTQTTWRSRLLGRARHLPRSRASCCGALADATGRTTGPTTTTTTIA